MFRIINFHIHLLTYPYLISIKFIAFSYQPMFRLMLISYFQLFISNYAQAVISNYAQVVISNYALVFILCFVHLGIRLVCFCYLVYFMI
jgi:hypothetical protein